jgi:hypothetical protein
LDGCELDEGEVVDCKFVVAGCDAPTLLDLAEEPFDQITRDTDQGLKHIGSLRLRFGGMFVHAPF